MNIALVAGVLTGSGKRIYDASVSQPGGENLAAAKNNTSLEVK